MLDEPAGEDEVMQELHAVREAYAARFGYDIDAICRDAQAKDGASGLEIASPSSKDPPEPANDRSKAA